MPEKAASNSGAPAANAAPPAAAPRAASLTPAGLSALLREAWQLPLLVVGLLGVAGAFWYSKAHKAPNQWDEALGQAVEQLEKHELSITHQILEDVIAPHLSQAPEEFLGRFALARADLAAAQLQTVSSPTQAEFEAVAARYDEAMKLGATLNFAQDERHRTALVGSHRDAEAIAAAERAGDREQARRLATRLARSQLQDAYDALRAGADARKVEDFFHAYEAFRAEPRIVAEDRAWATALAARTSLGGGHPEASSTRLQRELRLAELATGSGDLVSAQQLAELTYLLGEGMRQQREFEDAERELEHARASAKHSSVLAGEIDLALGRTKIELGRLDDAHAILDRAVLDEHPGDLKLGLLLARAHVRTLLGMDEDSRRDFTTLLDLHDDGALPPQLATEMLALLNDLAFAALGEPAYEDAIALAQLAKRVDDRGSLGARALITLAESAAHQARAMRDAEVERVGSPDEMERGVRADINIAFKLAGESYRAYMLTDDAKSLSAEERSELHFSAADSFDCASEKGLALEHFESSIDELPQRHGKRAERMIRIGDILFGEGHVAEALLAYERAAASSPSDPRVAMPRCRALAELGRNDLAQRARAQAELERILGGEAGHSADSAQYREALDLSARLSFENGDFVRSAMRLSELLERDPESPEAGGRQFRLGESLQAMARAAMEESKQEDLTASRRTEVSRLGSDRAHDAQRAFQRAIEGLEARKIVLEGSGRAFKDVDKLRNAYLQRGQCAFDRGEYQEAIDLLESVDRKFPEHAASLLALVQIVNAADLLGETKRAQTAHLRALRRIESLPEEDLAMGSVFSREEWKTWLRNHPPIRSVSASGATTHSPNDAPEEHQP